MSGVPLTPFENFSAPSQSPCGSWAAAGTAIKRLANAPNIDRHDFMTDCPLLESSTGFESSTGVQILVGPSMVVAFLIARKRRLAPRRLRLRRPAPPRAPCHARWLDNP